MRTRYQRARRRLRGPGVRCHGIIYGIPIHDAVTWQVRVDYIGQTVQLLADREAQHRACQPWSDLIAGPAFAIERGWWTQVELDAREAFHMRRIRPRYPYEYNLDNPERIPIYEARRQRRERDRARGIKSPSRRRPMARAERRPVSSRTPRWLVLPAAAAGLWILLCVLLPVGPALAVAVAVTVIGAKVR